MGSGGYSDGYEVGSKRPRMMESNPYFAVGSGYHQSYGGGGYSGGGSNYSGRSSNTYSFPVVRLRGLPFTCTDIDIFKFFAGLDVVDSLLVNKNGRFSGEAFVVFATPMQAEIALQRDRQNMGRRYVEVFKCKKEDYYLAIAAEVNHGGGGSYGSLELRHVSPPPPRAKKAYDDKVEMDYTEFLKLRGLPYSVTKTEIVDFFEDYKVSEDRVHIACRADGKATGEAYVEFSSSEEAKRAMSKDRMLIGSRYVELFPSTSEESKRAESRSR